MSVTVAINDAVASRLKVEADALRTSVEAVANGLLARLLPPVVTVSDDDLQAVVAKIRSTPPDASAIRPAQPIPPDSPLLMSDDDNDEFNEHEWNRQWAEIEASTKTQAMLNEMAEGRG